MANAELMCACILWKIEPGSAMMFKSGYFDELKCLFNASVMPTLKFLKSVSVPFCPGNPPPMSSMVKW